MSLDESPVNTLILCEETTERILQLVWAHIHKFDTTTTPIDNNAFIQQVALDVYDHSMPRKYGPRK